MAQKTHKGKAERQHAEAKAKHANDAQVVKMKFKEDKFYKDLQVAHFEKDKVYEIVGADQIQRWLKRGGEIVGGSFSTPEVVQNPSVIVPNQHTEQKPFDGHGEVDHSQEPSDSEPKENQEDGEVEIDLDSE